MLIIIIYELSLCYEKELLITFPLVSSSMSLKFTIYVKLYIFGLSQSIFALSLTVIAPFTGLISTKLGGVPSVGLRSAYFSLI